MPATSMGQTTPRLRTLPIYLRTLSLANERTSSAHLVPCPMLAGKLRGLDECRACTSCHHVSTPGREDDWLVVCGFDKPATSPDPIAPLPGEALVA